MNGSELGIRTQPEGRGLARLRTSASARSTTGARDVSPRSVLTIVGKKQRTAAIAIFEKGLRSPNQLFVIGANAMIGIAFAAIANGISAMPRVRKRARTSAGEDPERRSRARTRRPPP